MKTLALSLSVALSLSSPSHAETLTIHSEKNHNIELDGKLSEDVWEKSTIIKVNNVTYPYDNAVAPVDTTAYLLEDGEKIYVAFKAKIKNITELRASKRNRDEIENDDYVAIKIDTFSDARKAFMFAVNPYGVQKDLVDNEHNNTASINWDAVWESAGSIEEDQYVVEMAIPLSSLQYNDEDGQPLKWGLELLRFYPRNLIYRISHMPFDRERACRLCQMESISLFENREHVNSIDFTPEVTAGWERKRGDIASPWEHDSSNNIGITARWKTSPSSQFLGTINPNFSQVEADAGVLNVNEPFALYFQERRLFFTEAAELFESHDELVYTRNISSPTWGAKYTTQSGEHNLAAIIARDSETSILIPGMLRSSLHSLDEESTQGAVRYRYSLNQNASVGATGTLRKADVYENTLLSFDGKYRASDTTTFYYQDSLSRTQYPEDLLNYSCPDAECNNNNDAFSGRRTLFEIEEEQENLYVFLSYIKTDLGYRADLGFQNEVGTVKKEVYGYYDWFSETDWWTNVYLGGSSEYKDSIEGDFLGNKRTAFAGFSGPWQSTLHLEKIYAERIGINEQVGVVSSLGENTKFSNDGWSITLSASPTSWLKGNVYYSKMDAIDFSEDRQGMETLSSLSLQVRGSDDIEVSLDLSYNPFKIGRDTLYEASVADLRFVYNPTNKHQLKASVIYYKLKQNKDMYDYAVLENYKDWQLQLIYTYEVNSLTKVYAGVASIDYETSLTNKVGPITQSAFFKFSYGFSI